MIGKQRGGVLETSDLPSNVSGPTNWQLLLDWSHSLPAPVELNLELRKAEAPGSVFPIRNQSGYFAGSNWSGPPVYLANAQCGVMRLEFGAAVPRVLYADLQNGRYSLGVQRSVRVSVAFWGTTVLTSNLIIWGSVAPSNGDSDSLRYSANFPVINAGASVMMAVPPGARYFDCYPGVVDAGTANAPNVRVQGAVRCKRDMASGIYYPPSSPLPVEIANSGGSFVQIDNQGAAAVDVIATFFVQ